MLESWQNNNGLKDGVKISTRFNNLEAMKSLALICDSNSHYKYSLLSFLDEIELQLYIGEWRRYKNMLY